MLGEAAPEMTSDSNEANRTNEVMARMMMGKPATGLCTEQGARSRGIGAL